MTTTQSFPRKLYYVGVSSEGSFRADGYMVMCGCCLAQRRHDNNFEIEGDPEAAIILDSTPESSTDELDSCEDCCWPMD